MILATVPIARPLQNFLSSHFSDRIFYVFTAAFVLIGLDVFRRIITSDHSLRRRRLIGFFIVCLLYVWRISLLQVQVERFHLLEYGVLGILIAFAAMHHGAGVASFGFGLASGFAVGLCDEFFQWTWPDRYGEWRDVIINIEGSALALIALLILRPPRAMLRRPSRSALFWLFLIIAILSLASALFLNYTQTFGFMNLDPEVGRFKSFFSLARLQSIDAEAYQIIRQRGESAEADRRAREELYWYDREAKEHFDRANLSFECNLDQEGSLDAHIALKYFGPSLAFYGMSFSIESLDRMSRTHISDDPVLFSRVVNWLITETSRHQAVGIALVTAGLFFCLAMWFYFRRANPG